MSVTTVAQAFAHAHSEQRAALIGYLPAGFPDKQQSVELVRAMVGAGVDMVEIGIPYSDPVMDGPVICQAADIALAAGTTTADALEVVRRTSGAGAAILMMTYWNLVEQYGVARFAAELSAAGGAGVITPDLTPEEGAGWIGAADAAGLDHVFLAAPSSSDERLRVVAQASTGFVYAASLMGVTGVRSSVGSAAAELVGRLRGVTDMPVAVGLGVSTGEQAREVARFADGVIVGSAFVKRVLAADSPEQARSEVAALAGELADAVRRQ